QVAFLNKNRANPETLLGQQMTNGITGTYAFSLQRRRGRRRAMWDFRIGLSGKLLFRRGGYYDLSATDVIRLGTEKEQFLSPLVGNYGMGIGVDLGFQFLRR